MDEKHPVVYVAALIFGIISVVISVFWIFQILGHVINPDGQPLYAFMDSWFDSLDQGGGAFVATILFGILAIYI